MIKIFAFLAAMSITTGTYAQAEYQKAIDDVPFGGVNDNRDTSSWSPLQREVNEIVKRINAMQPNKKPRTDMIVKFGRNGIDVIQEYR